MLGFVLGWTSSSCDSSGPRLLSVSFRRGVPTLLTPRKRRARLTRDSLKEREGRRARRVRDATARAARFERHPSESLASASRLAASWSSQIGSIPIILGNSISVTRRSAPCRRARRADSRATPTAPPVAGAPTEPPSPAPRPSTFPGIPFRAILLRLRLREGTHRPFPSVGPSHDGAAAPRTHRRRLHVFPRRQIKRHLARRPRPPRRSSPRGDSSSSVLADGSSSATSSRVGSAFSRGSNSTPGTPPSIRAAEKQTKSAFGHGSALSPSDALEAHGACLTEYERSEIVEYPLVWYGGAGAKKTEGTKEPGALNHGYDDERGDYAIALRDHLAYRFEILEIWGKGSFGQVDALLRPQDKVDQGGEGDSEQEAVSSPGARGGKDPRASPSQGPEQRQWGGPHA